MRWSIVRLIWAREMRDQLRDRRTLFTILALPLLLYPLISIVALQFAQQLLEHTGKIGLVSETPESKTFPSPAEEGARTVYPPVSLLSLTPGGSAGALQQAGSAAAFYEASRQLCDYQLLLLDNNIPEMYRREQDQRLSVFSGDIDLHFQFLTEDQAKKALENKEVDLIVSASPDFMKQVISGKSPILRVRGRKNDNRSHLASEQFSILADRWYQHLKQVRFNRSGLSPEFDSPFVMRNALADAPEEMLAAESLLDLLVRTFPFMLVMWSLAGALYPAVDLCAGEKERGTMETLLISPADRREIVFGKFVTIWVFSAVTAIMHLVSMSLATWQLRSFLPQGSVTLPAMFWCVLLVLPLSALFGAVSLAVGAYARSSKEGQYYLMPLFWLTMPLVFLTMAPGVELNQVYSMVPVTGVALLMQRLMIAPSLDQVPWFYFFPVFATVMVYSWFALRWAVNQFQKEEVLFREAERMEVRLWLRHLFRDKELFPSLGQALFCFGVLLILRFISLDLGRGVPLIVRNAIIQASLIAAPPLIMGFLLTKKPHANLLMSWPRLGCLLAALLLLPLAEIAHICLNFFPSVADLLESRRVFVDNAYRDFGAQSIYSYSLHYIVVLSVLPAVCKEIAFRGFILSGLRRRFSDRSSVLLSGFLFAVFHMNVFAIIPLFLLGAVLGWLTVRSKSVIPAILLHSGCNLTMVAGPFAGSYAVFSAGNPAAGLTILIPLAAVCTVLAFLLLCQRDVTASKQLTPANKSVE